MVKLVNDVVTLVKAAIGIFAFIPIAVVGFLYLWSARPNSVECLETVTLLSSAPENINNAVCNHPRHKARVQPYVRDVFDVNETGEYAATVHCECIGDK